MNAIVINCRGCQANYLVLPIANRMYYCPYCHDFGGITISEIATGKYRIIHKPEVKKRASRSFTDYPFDPNVIEMGQL